MFLYYNFSIANSDSAVNAVPSLVGIVGTKETARKGNGRAYKFSLLHPVVIPRGFLYNKKGYNKKNENAGKGL